MKLKQINEQFIDQLVQRVLKEASAEATGQSRRNFLKRSGAGVASALLGQGIPIPVVTKAIAGKPSVAAFLLPSWDFPGGGGDKYHVNFGDTFREVGLLYSHLKKLGALPTLSSDGENVVCTIPLTTKVLGNMIGIKWEEDDEHTGGFLDFGDNTNDKPLSFSINPVLKVGAFRVDKDGEDGSNPWTGYGYNIDGSATGNPFIDFWNYQARFDALGVSENAGFVKRLLSNFGDKLEGIQILTPSGQATSLPWDKFDDFVANPEKYLDNRGWDPEELESEEPERQEEPTTEPYDAYDRLQMGAWSDDGGFTESRLNEALDLAIRGLLLHLKGG